MAKGRGLTNSSSTPAPGDDWAITLLKDAIADDSDKTFTVPAGEEWQILAIFVTLATDATVGDRQIQVLFADTTAASYHDARPSVVQAASRVRYYSLAPSLANLLAFYDTDLVTTPIPPTLFLVAGDTIRIWDNNAVAAAADDMTVAIKYALRG